MAHAYRDDFPLLKSQDVAYLDNAATAQRPQCVLDAVTEFYKSKNANPLRGLYPLSIAATEAYENAREAVRSFLNAKSSREIIFTRNTTESINLVAYSYGLSHVKAGDEVLVSIMEHHSNLLPWQMVCRQTGASLKFMECEMDGTLDLNKVEALITPKTKIVACTHVSNVRQVVLELRMQVVLGENFIVKASIFHNPFAPLAWKCCQAAGRPRIPCYKTRGLPARWTDASNRPEAAARSDGLRGWRRRRSRGSH